MLMAGRHPVELSRRPLETPNLREVNTGAWPRETCTSRKRIQREKLGPHLSLRQSQIRTEMEGGVRADEEEGSPGGERRDCVMCCRRSRSALDLH